MELAEPEVAGRLGINLRIGVTGHRWIDPQDAEMIAIARSAIAQIQDSCRTRSTPFTHVGLTVVSSLAEGADQIVAEAGLALGARLEVVLPLPADDLESDFANPDSLANFRRLMGRADTVSVIPGATRPQAYRASGDLVLQRCDVLLAMWDGQPAKGVGGTAEVVDAAGAANKPVAWIEVARSGAAAVPALRQLPHQVDLVSPEALDSLDQYNRQRLRETPQSGPVEGFARSGETGPVLLPSFLRADGVATRHQRAFRLVSILIYVLSVVAILLPAVQLVYFDERRYLLSAAEIVALLGVIVLLALVRRRSLLERWLGSRYLAERLRSLAFLAELSMADTLQTPATGRDYEVTASDEWRDRVVSELTLMVSRPSIDPGVLFRTASERLVDEWLRPQIGYHTGLRLGAERKSRRLRAVALALFGLSVAAAVAHLFGLKVTSHEDAVFVALAAPTVGAALSGYAAQRDYPRLVMTSRRMVQSLTAAIDDIERATTIEALRDVARRADIVLQGESLDWYAAARLRVPEVP